ncbi:hypothetical protein AAFF_G00352560 [Aldrovandia affinis]|uniref:Uncharacterized protein n=1 Tax=Aldrovandia affinis TaxID=143900 RepID=A0AAD7WPE3_9TELE|nr:hypothetical protein AAFF_G00352560 [Aldrovandia affinis]
MPSSGQDLWVPPVVPLPHAMPRDRGTVDCSLSVRVMGRSCAHSRRRVYSAVSDTPPPATLLAVLRSHMQGQITAWIGTTVHSNRGTLTNLLTKSSRKGVQKVSLVFTLFAKPRKLHKHTKSGTHGRLNISKPPPQKTHQFFL